MSNKIPGGVVLTDLMGWPRSSTRTFPQKQPPTAIIDKRVLPDTVFKVVYVRVFHIDFITGIQQYKSHSDRPAGRLTKRTLNACPSLVSDLNERVGAPQQIWPLKDEPFKLHGYASRHISHPQILRPYSCYCCRVLPFPIEQGHGVSRTGGRAGARGIGKTSIKCAE